MSEMRDRINHVLAGYRCEDQCGNDNAEPCNICLSRTLPLTDEVLAALAEPLDDAIHDAANTLLDHHMGDHNTCQCGARNNLDGDILDAHRAGILTETIRNTLGLNDD